MTTVFDGSAYPFNTAVTGFGGRTLRQVFTPAVLNAAAAAPFSVRFQFATGTSSTIGPAYIGHPGAGDPYDFDGNQVQLTFDGGSSTKAISGATIVNTDYVSFPSYSSSKNLIVSLYLGTGRANPSAYGAVVIVADTTETAAAADTWLAAALMAASRTETAATGDTVTGAAIMAAIAAESAAASDITALASAYDSATDAWIAAVGSDNISSGRKSLVDSLITGLKSDGVWSKLDRLWLFAAENETSALTDLKATALATAVNAPTPSSTGYTFNGSSNYINTGYNPASGTNYGRDSAHISVWPVTISSSAWAQHGNYDNTKGAGLEWGSTVWYMYVNDNTLSNTSITKGSTGLITITRPASGSRKLYVNGVSSYSDSVSSTGISSNNYYVGAGNAAGAATHYTTNKIATFSIGGSLTDTEVGYLYSRLRTYMTAVEPTLSLFKFEGTDGSTTFTENVGGHTLGTIGAPEIDTAQFKFGASSAYFNAANQAITYNAPPDLDFGTRDFTIDFWVRFPSASMGVQVGLFRAFTDIGSTFAWLISKDVGDNIVVNRSDVGNDLFTAASTIAADTWYHVALTRSSGTARLFLNGSLSVSGSSDWSSLSLGNNYSYPMVGSYATGGYLCWIDAFRISGKALWTANFTPPTSGDYP